MIEKSVWPFEIQRIQYDKAVSSCVARVEQDPYKLPQPAILIREVKTPSAEVKEEDEENIELKFRTLTNEEYEVKASDSESEIDSLENDSDWEDSEHQVVRKKRKLSKN